MIAEFLEMDIGIAQLIRVRPDHIEVRYAPGCILNTQGLAEVRAARRELMGDVPYSMLSIIPEDADFELSIMHSDHLVEDRREGRLRSIAVVVRANMINMLLKLYFSYYPPLTRIHICTEEAEARAWLHEQMEEG